MKRGIAAGLRGSAEPRRLHTTDTRRRRASVVRQAVSFDSFFALLRRSLFSVDAAFGSTVEVMVDRTQYVGTVIAPVSTCEPLCAILPERVECRYL